VSEEKNERGKRVKDEGGWKGGFEKLFSSYFSSLNA
jgi:hypothetical protein